MALRLDFSATKRRFAALGLTSNMFVNKHSDVKPKTAKRRFVAEKSKRKVMKVVNSLWTKKTKQKGH